MKDKKLDFGDYVTIEQHRYGGGPNEFYTHKVITRLESNTWVDVPVTGVLKHSQHDEMAEVVSCICCGVSETDVFKYRVCDVKYNPPSSASPQSGQASPEPRWPTEEEMRKVFREILSMYLTTNIIDRGDGKAITQINKSTAIEKLIQWLQTSGVKEGTREAELEKCFGEILYEMPLHYLVKNFSVSTSQALIWQEFITRAKSLLSKTI